MHNRKKARAVGHVALDALLLVCAKARAQQEAAAWP